MKALAIVIALVFLTFCIEWVSTICIAVIMLIGVFKLFSAIVEHGNW